MALNWPSKSPDEAYSYAWVPAFNGGVAEWEFLSTDVTIGTSEEANGAISVSISGGTVSTVAVITATALSTTGEEAAETFYLPIRDPAHAFGYTANDVCSHALRKVVGVTETMTAAMLADCVERLNDMIAAWKLRGIDVGVVFPLVSATVLDIDDGYIPAIKANLLLYVYPLYGAEPSPIDLDLAESWLRAVSNSMFVATDLGMPRIGSVPGTVASLF